MFKLRITNTSAERDDGQFARPIFLTEAGRLLQPGEAAPANRLNKGTDELVDCGDLKVEEGNFPAFVEAKKKKPVVEDDDEDDRPKVTKSTVADKSEKATLVTVDRKRSSKIIPMVAAGGDQKEDQEGDKDVMKAGGDDDDLDIPAVTKADLGTGTGLKDPEPSSSKPPPAPKVTGAGFHDNHNVGKPRN